MTTPTLTPTLPPIPTSTPGTLTLSPTATGDFTDFLDTSDKVMLISDTEGQLSTGIQSKIENFDGKVIFLGDMCDYTTPNVFNKENLVFLKYITLVNTQPNKYAAILGNRDLNKLNLWQLVQFENENANNNATKKANTNANNKTQNANNNTNNNTNNNANTKKNKNKWWTNGSDIMKIAKNLVRLVQEKQEDGRVTPKSLKSQPWLVKELNSFAPYWNSQNPNYSQWTGHTKYAKNPTLYNRYLSIFGVDPIVGTMSAQNVITGLLIEAGFSKPNIINPNYNDKELNNDKELAAAMVFTIFARMLDPELAVSSPPELPYDGALYTFFMNNPLVATINKNDNTYLFSHGGVHSNFTNQLYADIENLGSSISDFLSIPVQSQSGGSMSNDDITNFNRLIKEQISAFYADTKKFKNTQHSILRNLIALVCPISKNPIIQSRQYTNNKSPIMPGINTEFNLLYRDTKSPLMDVNPEKIYNIFGHAPFGFGYGFKIGMNKQKLIGCDFSSTVLKHYANDIDKYNQNTLNLTLTPSTANFTLDGSILCPKTPIISINSFDVLANDNQINDNIIFINTANSEDIAAKIGNDFEIRYNNKNPIDFSNKLPDTTSTDKIYWAYQGTGKVRWSGMNTNLDKFYNIFARSMQGSFKKQLILVELKDVQSLIQRYNQPVRGGGKTKKVKKTSNGKTKKVKKTSNGKTKKSKKL
jgi:hypothetical protein